MGCRAHRAAGGRSQAASSPRTQRAKGLSDAREPVYFNVCRRNFKPLVAISRRLGSILRQIAAALAITLTSLVNDSITTSPLYLTAFSALAMQSQPM